MGVAGDLQVHAMLRVVARGLGLVGQQQVHVRALGLLLHGGDVGGRPSATAGLSFWLDRRP
jgi:hypothetical protein